MPETPGGGWAPERLRAVAAGIERDFPLTSRRTLLSLFDLDPDQLQAQWQVESGQLALVRGAFPVGLEGIHQRLRLLREDAGQREVAALSLPAGELDAQGVARFLVSGGPGVLYRAELGLATPEGGWILLARSNLATLPPRPLRLIPPRPVGSGGDQEAARAPLPPSAPVPASEEAAPPWDPTLADTGQELEPEFPRPPTVAGPAVGAFSQPPGALRSRPASGRMSPPLVIARNLPPGQNRSSTVGIAAPRSPLAPARGFEVPPASAGQTSPLLPLASAGPTSSSLPSARPDVTVQPPPPHGLGSMAQTTDSLAPSPLVGEGWGEGAERLRPDPTSPLLATFDPRGTRSSPGSGATSASAVGDPSSAWPDPGGQGLDARYWLFAYPHGTPAAAGPGPHPVEPAPSPRP